MEPPGRYPAIVWGSRCLTFFIGSRKEFGQRLGPHPPVSGAQIFWLDEVMHRLPAKRRNTIGALIIRIGFWGPVHLLVMLGDISFALPS